MQDQVTIMGQAGLPQGKPGVTTTQSIAIPRGLCENTLSFFKKAFNRVLNYLCFNW